MLFESFDTVFYTCIFLLPGFVIKTIIDTLTPQPKQNELKYVLSCLMYSIVNCAVCSWAYILISEWKWLEGKIALYWVLVLLVTMFFATLIAVVIGLARQKEIISRFFCKIGVNKFHSVPTAWDYFFSKQESTWVIVRLKSGQTIYGKYANKSFSSSDPEERDLYIEQIYRPNKNMEWQEVERNNGILITKEEIETIEFFT